MRGRRSHSAKPRSEGRSMLGAHQVAVRPDEVLLAQAAGSQDALLAHGSLGSLRGLRLGRRHADLKHVATDAPAQRLGHHHRAWPAPGPSEAAITPGPSERLMRGIKYATRK